MRSGLGLLALLILGAAPQTAGAAPPVVPWISPSIGMEGRSETFTVTVHLPDPKVLPSSVLLYRVNAAGTVLERIGTLGDAGLDGDAAATDGVFSRSFASTPQATPYYFRVSYALSGVLKRTNLDFTLPVMRRAPVPSESDLHGSLEGLLSAAVRLRTALTSLRAESAFDPAMFNTLMTGVGADALNVSQGATAVLDFETRRLSLALAARPVAMGAGRAGETPERRAGHARHGLSRVAFRPSRLTGLVSGSRDWSSAAPGATQGLGSPADLVPGYETASDLFEAGKHSQTTRARIKRFGEAPKDPRVRDLAQVCKDHVDDPSLVLERELCARQYELSADNKNGFLSQTRSKVKNIAVRQAMEPATNLVSSAISEANDVGVVATAAVHGVVGKVFGWFASDSGSVKGIVIGEAGDDDAFHIPASHASFVYVAGPEYAPSVVTNVRVDPTRTTRLSFVPGEAVHYGGTAPNTPPRAAFVISAAGQVPTGTGLRVRADEVTREAQVSFMDASSDADGTGDIVGRDWTVNTRTTPLCVDTAQCVAAFAPGQYVVTLTVRDAGGLTSAVAGNLVVEPAISTAPVGEPLDWAGVAALLVDAAGDGPLTAAGLNDASLDLLRIKAKNDIWTQWFLIEFAGVHSRGLKLYLDTDVDASTGCNGNEIVVFVPEGSTTGKLELADYRDCKYELDEFTAGAVAFTPNAGDGRYLEIRIPREVLQCCGDSLVRAMRVSASTGATGATPDLIGPPAVYRVTGLTSPGLPIADVK